MGQHAIQALHSPNLRDLSVRIGAVSSCPIQRILPEHRSRRLDRVTQFALLAVAEAWSSDHARQHKADRIGVVFSTGIGGVNRLIEQLDVLERSGSAKVSPHTVAMIMPNATAAHVSLGLGATGWLESPASACSGGAEAILRGVMLLRAGVVDVVVAGGAEAILNRFGLAAFAAMQALSTTNEDPAQASRPFDCQRNGFVLGEGAGALVLERLEDVLERGVPIHGLIRGIGTTVDGFDIVAPRPDGRQACLAMQRALSDAGIEAGQLQLVKAHATGTRLGDLAEAKALAELWSSYLRSAHAEERSGPLLIAPKAALGHLISASGPVECILSLAALAEARVPAQLNCHTPEPELPFVLPSQPQVLRPVPGMPPLALVNSFGFGGKNVSLVLEGAVAQAASP